MKLREPTDFLILEALDDRGRNVATNLAHHIDKGRKNINTRLPVLRDYGLVRKIGPAARSGLYEITRRGRLALMYRDQYGDVEDFEALLESVEVPDASTVESPDRALARNAPDLEDEATGSDADDESTE